MGNYTGYTNGVRLLISEFGYGEIVKPEISIILTSLTFSTESSKLNKIRQANCKPLCLSDSEKTTSDSRKEIRKIPDKKFGQKSQFEE